MDTQAYIWKHPTRTLKLIVLKHLRTTKYNLTPHLSTLLALLAHLTRARSRINNCRVLLANCTISIFLKYKNITICLIHSNKLYNPHSPIYLWGKGGQMLPKLDLGQLNLYLSHVMRKPVLAICKRQMCRSACASTQSDQRLYCLLPG